MDMSLSDFAEPATDDWIPMNDVATGGVSIGHLAATGADTVAVRGFRLAGERW